MVDDLRGALADLPTRAEREPVVGVGEGGDETTAIDAAAENAIVRRLESLGEHVTIVSEELGERGDGETRVVVDPAIDASGHRHTVRIAPAMRNDTRLNPESIAHSAFGLNEKSAVPKLVGPANPSQSSAPANTP